MLFVPRMLARPAIVLLAVGVGAAEAQTIVSGTVVDTARGEPLAAATVRAERPTDSTLVGTASGADGQFSLALPNGRWRLRVSFVGYLAAERSVAVNGRPLDLGRVALRPDTTVLNDAVVEAVQTRVEVRGDTVVFNADAFSTPPNATTGELLSRMPGAVVEGGQVQVNGKTIQRVLVDGKEFYGGDVQAALDALPARAVQMIEVYERGSAQARLTGFRDGQEETTVNVVTTAQARRSLFGRARAGVGTDLRFSTQGEANRLDGDRRFSVKASGDNVDSETLAALNGGVIPSVGEGVSRNGRLSLSANDTWGDAAEVSAYYSLTASDGTSDTALSRDYLLADAAGQRYGETFVATHGYAGHIAGGRAEIVLSERTFLEIAPRVRFDGDTDDGVRSARTVLASGDLAGQSRTAFVDRERGLEASLDATVGRRFETEGRTLSLNVELGAGRGDRDRDQDVERRPGDAFGRRVAEARRGWTGALALAYTESLADSVQLKLTYRPAFSTERADQDADRLDALNRPIGSDPALTLDSDGRTVNHQVGVSVQRQWADVTATVGLAGGVERLAYRLDGARPFDVDRTTVSLAPSLQVRATLGEQTRLVASYEASTRAPRGLQLRDVVDDTNPLVVTSGNPALRPERTHSLSLRLQTADPTAGTSLSASLSGQTTRDYVGTATVFGGASGTVVRGVAVPAGGQFSSPANLGRSTSARAYVTYGRPIPGWDGNLHTSVSAGLARTPGLIGDVMTQADVANAAARLFASASPGDRLDLSGSYDIQGDAVLGRGRGTLTHTVRTGTEWRPRGPLVLRSSLQATFVPGLQGEGSPLRGRLDLEAGYTFLADDQAELRVTVADALDARTPVFRRVTDAFILETRQQAVGRFVLFSVLYALRPPS